MKTWITTLNSFLTKVLNNLKLHWSGKINNIFMPKIRNNTNESSSQYKTSMVEMLKNNFPETIGIFKYLYA